MAITLKRKSKSFINETWNKLIRMYAPGLEGLDFFGALYSTTEGPITLYVNATTGLDGNDGTISSPFATIQTALDTLPNEIRHPVNIEVAEGNYPGFYVSGFTFMAPESPALGSFLQIKGTLVPATLSTGANGGFVSSASTGSGQVFGTLTDSSQSWTTNELKGKVVEIISGVGLTAFPQVFPITANTSTSLTIAGNWATTPTSGSGYSIKSWGTNIVSPVDIPATATAASFPTLGGAAYVACNNVFAATDIVVMTNLNLAGSTNSAVIRGNGGVGFLQCNLSGTTGRLSVANATELRVRRCVSIGSPGLLHFNFGNNDSQSNFTIQNCLIDTGSTGVGLNQCYGGVFTSCQLNSLTTAVSAAGLEGRVQFASCRFDTGTNCFFTNNGAGQAGFQSYSLNLCDISNFTTAINMTSPGCVILAGITGSGNGTIINANQGAKIKVLSSVAVTGSSNDILLDGTAYSFTTMRGNTPKLVSSPYFSIVYE